MVFIAGLAGTTACFHQNKKNTDEEPAVYETFLNKAFTDSIFSHTGRDSAVLKKILPQIYVIRNTYIWTITPEEAEKRGISPENYRKVVDCIDHFNK